MEKRTGEFLNGMLVNPRPGEREIRAKAFGYTGRGLQCGKKRAKKEGL